jgi:hypothetical protein
VGTVSPRAQTPAIIAINVMVVGGMLFGAGAFNVWTRSSRGASLGRVRQR